MDVKRFGNEIGPGDGLNRCETISNGSEADGKQSWDRAETDVQRTTDEYEPVLNGTKHVFGRI